MGGTEFAFRLVELNCRAADRDRNRLYAALERFLKLGDTLDEYLVFGKQNPDFFPVTIVDHAQKSFTEPGPGPWVKGRRWPAGASEAQHYWTKLVTWEPVCHQLVLDYRNILQRAWREPKIRLDVDNGELFEVLMGCESRPYGFQAAALRPVFEAHPRAELYLNPIMADWSSGTFVFNPDSDFRRAVYLLFRENWRARRCKRCLGPFVAHTPRSEYCSLKCAGEARLQQHLNSWNKHGKLRRAERRRKRTRAPGRRRPKRRV